MITLAQFQKITEDCKAVHETYARDAGPYFDYFPLMAEIRQAIQQDNNVLVKVKLEELKKVISRLGSTYERLAGEYKNVDVGDYQYEKQFVGGYLVGSAELLIELDNAINEQKKYATGYQESEKASEQLKTMAQSFAPVKAQVNNNNNQVRVPAPKIITENLKMITVEEINSTENGAEKLKQLCTASTPTLKEGKWVATGLFDKIEKDFEVYENVNTAKEVREIRITMRKIKGLFNKDPLDTDALAESLNTLKNQLEPLSRFTRTQYANVSEETTDSYGFSTGSNSVGREIITGLPTCKGIVENGFCALLDKYTYIPGGIDIVGMNQLEDFKAMVKRYEPHKQGITVDSWRHGEFKTELNNDINKAIKKLDVLSVDSMNSLKEDLEAVQKKLAEADVHFFKGDIGPNDHKKFKAIVNKMLDETNKKILALNSSASSSPNANNNNNQGYGSGYPHLLSQPSSPKTDPGTSPDQKPPTGLGKGG